MQKYTQISSHATWGLEEARPGWPQLPGWLIGYTLANFSSKMLKSEIERNKNWCPWYKQGLRGCAALQLSKEAKAAIQQLQKGIEEGKNKENLQLSQMKSWGGETNRLGKIAWRKVNPSKVTKKINRRNQTERDVRLSDEKMDYFWPLEKVTKGK